LRLIVFISCISQPLHYAITIYCRHYFSLADYLLIAIAIISPIAAFIDIDIFIDFGFAIQPLRQLRH
jgi:hypothetical protein